MTIRPSAYSCKSGKVCKKVRTSLLGSEPSVGLEPITRVTLLLRPENDTGVGKGLA